MTRIKGGILHAKRRRNILKFTKGYRWGRKSKIKLAKVAKMRAGAYAYADRRVKKRQRRRLFQVRLNAGARKYGLSYSRLLGALKAKGIVLNRKILAELALNHPTIFAQVVEYVK
ncbi:MAG: 50S ribosomal protein L20 [Candidatus Magasanikbacteria bacterium]|nr:50S ribosomal protein L20 [Candidatus Magasanikbacteria bacterium]